MEFLAVLQVEIRVHMFLIYGTKKERRILNNEMLL